MKKIITTSSILVLLLTNLQADFDFGNVFKDLKKAEMTMSKNAKRSIAKLPKTDFIFGDAFKELKEEKIAMSNNNDSMVKLPKTEFVFGDIFKELKEAQIAMSKGAA